MIWCITSGIESDSLNHLFPFAGVDNFYFCMSDTAIWIPDRKKGSEKVTKKNLWRKRIMTNIVGLQIF